MDIKILKQLGMILGLCLVAEGIISLLPIAFPSSVMAIFILFVLLITKCWKEEQIRETGDFMLSNMALVFVPISVGMVEDLAVLKGQLTGFLVVVMISLLITFLGTYATVRIVQKCMIKLSIKGDKER